MDWFELQGKWKLEIMFFTKSLVYLNNLIRCKKLYGVANWDRMGCVYLCIYMDINGHIWTYMDI